MKLILSILMLHIYVNVLAQKMPSDYFDEASNYYEDGDIDKALDGYKYIVNHYPKNELYPKAFYNVGYLYFVQKDYNKAIPIFKSILESDFNERESLGGGIMADPYANFRHKASDILSDIYYEKKMFESSLQYFALSDTAYPYLHYCGNEYASNDVYTALRYADIYQKLNQPDKAIEKLLPAVFISLANNSKIIDELKKLFIGKKELKIELDSSLNNIYIKKIDRKDYSYTKSYFKFLNVEIEVPYSHKLTEDFNEKKMTIEEIQNTDFYKMIADI